MEPVQTASSAAGPRPPEAGRTGTADGAAPADRARCVLCGKPTEHPATARGATLCPVCEWQEAERTACSG